MQKKKKQRIEKKRVAIMVEALVHLNDEREKELSKVSARCEK
jgi:hypothetical protein